MPDLDTTIADGDPGHALLHQDANTEVNSLRGRAATLESTVSGHTTSIATKYTKPATGIPLADLSTSVQNSIAGGQLGTLNNPQTNATAARTSGLPFMVWDTATVPTNKITGDINIHPDAI